MTPEELFKELKNGELRSAYYLFGEEDYLKEESFKKLKASALDGVMVDFNFDLFYGGETEISKIIGAASTLPVMSPRRLVVLKDADRLKAPDEEQITAYLEDPLNSTILLLVGRNVDKRKKLYLAFNRSGAAVDHARPYEREMPKWIRWVAGKKGYEISREACSYLVDVIGNDLGAIASEIEKVSLYVGERKSIGLEDVEAVTVDVKARTIFQLVDSIGTKDLKGSIGNLKKLLDGGESPIMVLSMIARQLRLIWIGLDIMKRGGSEGDVKKGVKLPPFVFKNYLKQVRCFSGEELGDAFEGLAQLDIKFKSTGIDKVKALELFLFNLCGNSRRPKMKKSA